MEYEMDQLDEALLLKYLQGECTATDWQQLSEWLKTSEENGKQLFALEETFHSDKKRRFSATTFLEEQEKKLNHNITAYETQRKKSLILRNVKYAAVFLLACGLGLAWYFTANHSSEEVIISVASNEPIKKLVLPDGTKVWLNQNSLLRYPSHFSADQRQVVLEGEAYFEVTKDRKRPFQVETEAMHIKVLGTIFNLKCVKGSNTAETSLIEGEIEVKGNQEEGQIVLSPGQKAELNRINKRLYVKQVNTKLDAVWHNDLIPFDQATIFEIANTLERFYHIKIILSPEIDTKTTYSGVVPRKESIEYVLQALKNSIPIHYKISGSNIYLMKNK